METKINQEIRTALKHFDDKYFIDGTVNKQRPELFILPETLT